jgi:hypothetical protein
MRISDHITKSICLALFILSFVKGDILKLGKCPSVEPQRDFENRMVRLLLFHLVFQSIQLLKTLCD